MSKILIVRHVASEGPGYLSEFLDRQQIAYSIFAMDAGDALPVSLEGIGGLVFMGGPMSVNDDLPWIAHALTLIQTAFDNDIPVLGHCLGGQLMAKALGASVTANPVPEYGWLPVRVADNESARDWFGNNSNVFDAFHWHGETFALPDGATHVLSSAHCHNQAFVIGNSLAMQCHIEMTATLVTDWVDKTDDTTLSPTDSTQSGQVILENLEDKITTLQSHADMVYQRWIKGLR